MLGRPVPVRVATVRAVAVALAGAAVLAGCGSVRYGTAGTGTGQSTGNVATPVPGHVAITPYPAPVPSEVTGTGPTAGTPPAGPYAGSRAAALSLARDLLSRVRFPPGARHSPGALPGPLRKIQPGLIGADSADLSASWQVPGTMAGIAGFLSTHVPAGMSYEGRGQAGSVGGAITMENVSYELRSPPRGIYQARLNLVVAAAGQGVSAVRGDAVVTWYPARSAAEYVSPGRFRAVTVTSAAPGSARALTRTFTSPAVIAGLAALLNHMPARPELGPVSCPAIIVGTRAPTLEFATAPGARPYLVAVQSRCPAGVQVTVNGQPQPGLAGDISLTADALLGIGPKGA